MHKVETSDGGPESKTETQGMCLRPFSLDTLPSHANKVATIC